MTIEYASPSPTPSRPRIWPVFVNFGVMFCSVIAAAVVLGAALEVLRHTCYAGSISLQEMITWPVVFFGFAVFTQLVVCAAAVTAALCSPQPWRERLAIRRSTLTPIAQLVVAAGATGLSTGVGVLTFLLGMQSESTQDLNQIIVQAPPAWWGLGFLAVVIMAPVCEEIFFRGYMQSRLSARLGPVWAILITSTFFGFMHLYPIHSVQTFFLGIVLGYIAWRSGSIVPAIVAHFVNNLFAYLAAPVESWGFYVALVPFFVCGLVGGVYLVSRAARPGAVGVGEPVG